MKNVDINGDYTICMTINKKRFEYMCKNFEAVGLKKPREFNGVRWNNGSNTGCVIAHMSILMMCRTMNYPYCIVLEDDSYPRPDILKTFEYIKSKLPDDCGLLKLGSSSYRGDAKVVGDCFYQMLNGTAFGSHAYIIMRDLYDRYLDTIADVKVPDVAMNLQYYKDTKLKPYVLNEDYQMFIQKNINADNIIANKGGQRYWYPDRKTHAGCTASIPCEHFVDRLIDDEDKYIEKLNIAINKRWEKGKRTVILRGDKIVSKDEVGLIIPMKENSWMIKWLHPKFGVIEFMKYKYENNGVRFFEIKETND